MKDLYVIRKFIMAKNAEDALKEERKHKVSEVYIDNDWLKHKSEQIIDNKIYKK